MKTNGLSEANGLRAGQKVVIPTYVYNTKAPVSAPDNNPKVADAKSSHGNKSDAPAGKLPAPLDAPSDKVAVLPKSPKLKEGETQPPASTEATAAKGGQGRRLQGRQLHGRIGRHAVQDRQEEWRQRRRAEEGERPQ